MHSEWKASPVNGALNTLTVLPAGGVPQVCPEYDT